MSNTTFTNPHSKTVSVGYNVLQNPIIKITDNYGVLTSSALTGENVVPFVNEVIKNSNLARPVVKKFATDAGKETVVVTNDGVEARVYVPTNEATAKRNLSMALANFEAHRQWTSGLAAQRADGDLTKFDTQALALYNEFYQETYASWGVVNGGSGTTVTTREMWKKKARDHSKTLRVGTFADAGLKSYNDATRSYATWGDVRFGSGTSDEMVAFYNQAATREGAGRVKHIGAAATVAYNAEYLTSYRTWADVCENSWSGQLKRNELIADATKAHDELRTSADALAGLATYNKAGFNYKSWDATNCGDGNPDRMIKSYVTDAKLTAAKKDVRNDAGLVYYNAQQGTKFGSWKDTDLTDPAFIEQWAKLAEDASKIVAPIPVTPPVAKFNSIFPTGGSLYDSIFGSGRNSAAYSTRW